MNFIFKVLGVCAAALVVSCGGGGGSISQDFSQSSTFSAAKYAGFYLGPCEPIPGAINMEANTALYGRLYQAVGQSTTATAPFQWRVDFFDTSICSGSAIGYVENKNAANKITIVGQASTGGKTVDKVVVAFGAADSSTALNVTSNTIEMGTAIRLSLPKNIFSAFESPDLWYIDAGRLFQGGLVVGPDDFPVALDTAAPYVQLSAALPVPAAPCGATSATWQISTISCSSALAPSASGLIANAIDAVGPSTGNAQFSCSNGAWSAPIAATCTAPITCPPGSVTWSVGGNSCTGTVNISIPTNVGGKEFASTNSQTGNAGTAYLVCNAVGAWEIEPVFQSVASCAPIPPPKPRTTDPLQLANEKNCMNCHTLTGLSLGYSFQRIANFYRNAPPAPGVLENKIIQGGIGTFGNVPMPSNPQVDAQDLAILVPWILSQ